MKRGDRVRVVNPNLISYGCVGKVTWCYDSSKDGSVDVLLDKGNSITIRKSNLELEAPIEHALSIGDRVRVDNPNLTTYGLVGTIETKVNGLFVVSLNSCSMTWNGFITVHPKNLAKVDSDKQTTSPTHHLTLGQLEPKLIKLFRESKTADLFYDVKDEELARYAVHALRNLLEHDQHSWGL